VVDAAPIVVIAGRGERRSVFVIGYAVSAAVWAFCWIPFSFGYYGFPWQSHAFRIGVQVWAWLHLLLGGSLLFACFLRRWRARTIIAVAGAILLSAFGCWAMYDWIARFVAA
jgi:hypothetical protein